MMDYDELVGRLRHYTKTEPYYKHTFTQSADAIETLRRERDEAVARAEGEQEAYEFCFRELTALLAERDAIRALLREAGEVLEPFCDPANPHTNGDYLRARAVLAKIKGEGE